MDLRVLQAFIRVAELGSIARAARSRSAAAVNCFVIDPILKRITGVAGTFGLSFALP